MTTELKSWSHNMLRLLFTLNMLHFDKLYTIMFSRNLHDCCMFSRYFLPQLEEMIGHLFSTRKSKPSICIGLLPSSQLNSVHYVSKKKKSKVWSLFGIYMIRHANSLRQQAKILTDLYNCSNVTTADIYGSNSSIWKLVWCVHTKGK